MTTMDAPSARADDHAQEGWVSHAASVAWDATARGAGFLKDELAYAFDKHPILTSIGCGAAALAIGIPTARFGFDRVGARLALVAESQIQTGQPFRSLIRIDGYGSSRMGAVKMERIVAEARDGFIAGDLKNAAEIERSIARRYLPDFRNDNLEFMARPYSYATSLPKHRTYSPVFDEVTSAAPARTYVSRTTLEGKEVEFMKTTFDRHDQKVTWDLAMGKEPRVLAAARIDNLFGELIGQSGQRTDAVLKSQLEKVAELEWLNAQTWKYARGSSGVSQLEARTWMELAGIDSGRFKAGIDPNLEALTRTLPDFKAAYPAFFKKPPSFFESPKFSLQYPLVNPVSALRPVPQAA